MIADAVDKPVTAWRQRWRDELNFVVTNRVPRALLTRFMGWYSRIDSPPLTRVSIAVWRLFSDLDLSEARPQRWRSLRDVFTRELRPGLRPVATDPALIASPCDAIVGACGRIEGDQVLQAKGSPYPLAELLGSAALAARCPGGTYVTLRLTSGMYHRFHAPADGHVKRVTYISGDTWNVNPQALARVPRLFCKNERAVIELQCTDGARLLLVPVAAILVASIRLHFIDVLLHLRWRGANVMRCDVAVVKGQELGWFEQGSTIIVIAPAGNVLCDGIGPGRRIRMGQGLLRHCHDAVAGGPQH